MQPISRSWSYDGPELKGQHVNVTRRQLPLGPAKVLPLYSMQGMTAEPGLVAHWTFPPRLDYDIKWLICYVILSRVPSLPQLMSIGLSDKIREIIEGGRLITWFKLSILCSKIRPSRPWLLRWRREVGSDGDARILRRRSDPCDRPILSTSSPDPCDTDACR